jgi:hypothetical protein
MSNQFGLIDMPRVKWPPQRLIKGNDYRNNENKKS